MKSNCSCGIAPLASAADLRASAYNLGGTVFANSELIFQSLSINNVPKSFACCFSASVS
jgi:hypothetical protein